MYFLSFRYEDLCTKCLDLDLFHSIYIILCRCYIKHIIIDLVHVDENRYIINPAKNKVIWQLQKQDMALLALPILCKGAETWF